MVKRSKKTILVPIDGSEEAKAASERAAELVRSEFSLIFLFFVLFFLPRSSDKFFRPIQTLMTSSS
jgi:nucleotide-binding universal stress UspA family protein